MLVKLQVNKNTLSLWIISTFILSLLIGGLASEFFQAPVSTTKALEKYQQLFSTEDLSNIQSFTFKNKLGEFSLNKLNHWVLTQPREIDANTKTVSNILESLTKLKIRKIYTKDAINISNFSLDTPSILVTLNINGKTRRLKYGLSNPIDNSTYIMLDDVDAIYHVGRVKLELEKYNLSDFIDSRIFTVDLNEVEYIKSYMKGKGQRPRLHFYKKDQEWRGPKGKLDKEKVENYLKEMFTVKSNIILDKRTDKLNERINRYLEKPYIKIEVKEQNEEPIVYEFSYVFNGLPDIKIEKKQSFIIRASNRRHPFVVSRSLLKKFSKSQKSFPPLNIKRLFY